MFSRRRLRLFPSRLIARYMLVSYLLTTILWWSIKPCLHVLFVNIISIAVATESSRVARLCHVLFAFLIVTTRGLLLLPVGLGRCLATSSSQYLCQANGLPMMCAHDSGKPAGDVAMEIFHLYGVAWIVQQRHLVSSKPQLNQSIGCDLFCVYMYCWSKQNLDGGGCTNATANTAIARPVAWLIGK